MSVSVYNTGASKDTPQPARRNHRPLDEMIRRPQWTGLVLERRDGKMTKILKNPRTGANAKVNDPATWGTYAEAWALVRAGKARGVSYIVSADDPFTFIDMDHCRDPETGEIEPWALDIMDEMDSYAEPSVSGTGVHIIGYGKKGVDRCRNWKHPHGGQIEIYDDVRQVAMTERPIRGYETVRDIQTPLDTFTTEHWTRHQVKPAPTPAADRHSVSLDTAEIIRKASNARNGAKFRALYEHGDTSGYGGDHSSADSALCCMLALYTKDPAQILEIWRASALYRDKTDRADYAERTITNALELVTVNYSPTARHVIIRETIATPPEDLDGLTVDELRARLARAEARSKAFEDAFTAVTEIIKIEDLDASTRLTACGVLLLGLEFQAKGHKTSEHGDHHMPASWIGRYSGQKPQTVNRQLNRMQDAGLIDRDVRQETTLQTVDLVGDGGEILGEDTYERKGNKNFITLPKNVIDIVPRLTGYQKPKDAPKRGGARVPKCDKHPDAAGVVRRTAYYCEHCYYDAEKAGAPLPRPLSMTDPVTLPRAEARPDIKLESDNPTVSLGDIKLESDHRHEHPTLTDRVHADRPSAPIKLEPDPASLTVESWEDERCRVYGTVYRGATA